MGRPPERLANLSSRPIPAGTRDRGEIQAAQASRRRFQGVCVSERFTRATSATRPDCLACFGSGGGRTHAALGRKAGGGRRTDVPAPYGSPFARLTGGVSGADRLRFRSARTSGASRPHPLAGRAVQPRYANLNDGYQRRKMIERISNRRPGSRNISRTCVWFCRSRAFTRRFFLISKLRSLSRRLERHPPLVRYSSRLDHTASRSLLATKRQPPPQGH